MCDQKPRHAECANKKTRARNLCLAVGRWHLDRRRLCLKHKFLKDAKIGVDLTSPGDLADASSLAILLDRGRRRPCKKLTRSSETDKVMRRIRA